MKLTRPLLRWHGGKWLLAPWIISYFPPHRIYCEPFGGAASVLLRKSRSYAEVYNDLDDDVVNLFHVLRSEAARDLVDLLRLTPFARSEFEAAYSPPINAVEKARSLIVRSFMGFGSDGHNSARMTGFRANSSRSGTTPAHDWANYPDCLLHIIDRLQGVVIERRPAVAVMATADSPETLHYVDPPYIHSTRAKALNSTMKNYTHELSDDDHLELLQFLKSLQGSVILSGYDHPLYVEQLRGWRVETRSALADGARKRVECLWLNPMAAAHTPTLMDAMNEGVSQ